MTSPTCGHTKILVIEPLDLLGDWISFTLALILCTSASIYGVTLSPGTFARPMGAINTSLYKLTGMVGKGFKKLRAPIYSFTIPSWF